MAEQSRILVVDDEKPIRDILSASLLDDNYIVDTASDGASGLEKIESFQPNIVLLDIWMPGDLDGIDVLRESKKANPNIEFIVMSGHGTIETAVKATKLGAWDFVEKPISLDKINILLNNILAYQKEKSQKDLLLNKLRRNIALIGDSVELRELKEKVVRLNPKIKTVFFTGEMGVGKELVAQNVHYFSPRAVGPVIDVNCAVTPEELQESEIFGFEKEAFTGAKNGKIGKIEIADSGTLIIKEVEKLTKTAQLKLVKFINSSKFSRVKGSNEIASDARIIFTSNLSLSEIVEDKLVESELIDLMRENYFHVPALRERKADIPSLITHFGESFAKDGGHEIKIFTSESLEVLANYEWPGNVRELRNFIERIYILIESTKVEPSDLHVAGLAMEVTPSIGIEEGDSLKEARAGFEKEFILKKLAENDGNISKTAEMIGVERSHLHRKIKSYGIDL